MYETAQQTLEGPIAWTLDEPLARISFFRDWDYVTSSFGSLKYYWREFGTIPHWDITMCGGKPSLANPNNWAFTWQSLFAYLLEPIWASLALWIFLSCVGFCAMWLLLKRFGCSRFAALCGATLFVFNGFFSSHFNQGHQGFATFHLVPLLILAFEVCLQRLISGQRYHKSFFLLVLVSVFFFTAAVPHGIFHFYPAFLIYVFIRFFRLGRQEGFVKTGRGVMITMGAHWLALWIAIYKIAPIVVWQLNFPRQGVYPERISFMEVANQFLLFVPDYFEIKQYFDSQTWGYWENNAFIGPIALLIVGMGFLFLVIQRSANRLVKLPAPLKLGLAFGCTCLTFGVLMALGNDHPFSPARLFRYLPLLNGIRVFGRYHILNLFGLSILLACAITILSTWRPISQLKIPYRVILQIVLMVGICGPGIWQSGHLIWNIKGLPYSFLEAKVYPNMNTTPKRPFLIKALRNGFNTMQSFLLDHGFFAAECYEPMANQYVNLSQMPVGSIYPLASSPSVTFAAATTNSFSLDFGEDTSNQVQINLLLPQSFTPNIQGLRNEMGFWVYEGRDLANKRLTIDTTMAADQWSAVASALGLLSTGAMFFLL